MVSFQAEPTDAQRLGAERPQGVVEVPLNGLGAVRLRLGVAALLLDSEADFRRRQFAEHLFGGERFCGRLGWRGGSRYGGGRWRGGGRGVGCVGAAAAGSTDTDPAGGIRAWTTRPAAHPQPDGCNDQAGRWVTAAGGSLLATARPTTLAFCADSVPIDQWLTTARRAGLDGNVLVLLNAHGDETGRLSPTN
ncbi:hypothetical protein [Micromonospora saelicesensis]|uniref:hypothetical protein n=1 Tax=Micromonospora saelicesensis TaxID=285676 RepID=UPI0011BEE283|nr:hypothetical protein [Micromonospora saelicesensis]